MTAKGRKALEQIRSVLAEETKPQRLTKPEYLEVMEELASDLEIAIEATRDEIKAEGDEE